MSKINPDLNETNTKIGSKKSLPVGGLLAAAAVGAAAYYFLGSKKSQQRRRAVKGQLKNFLPLSSGQKSMAFEESVTFDSPISEVFAFFSRYENFPQFMRNIRTVKDLGDGRLHWTARGPNGAPVSWYAHLTEKVPDEVIAWETEPGAVIENSGRIRFVEVGNERTLVRIHFRYTPPLGDLGHKIAHVFGADPAQEMREDLKRVRAYFVTGRPSSDAAREAGKTGALPAVTTPSRNASLPDKGLPI